MIGVRARTGVRLQGLDPATSGVIDMNLAGAANAFTIFHLSNYANMVGTATFILKRVKGMNNAGADTEIHIGRGTGGAFVDMIPPLLTINGMNFDFVELDIPEVEWNVDMMCYPVTANVIIMVEVEEIK